MQNTFKNQGGNTRPVTEALGCTGKDGLDASASRLFYQRCGQDCSHPPLSKSLAKEPAGPRMLT